MVPWIDQDAGGPTGILYPVDARFPARHEPSAGRMRVGQEIQTPRRGGIAGEQR
jgi:hypothetical protein